MWTTDGRTDGRRTTDGRTTEHGYTISSPCEPDGSGELKKKKKSVGCDIAYTISLSMLKVMSDLVSLRRAAHMDFGDQVFELFHRKYSCFLLSGKSFYCVGKLCGFINR